MDEILLDIKIDSFSYGENKVLYKNDIEIKRGEFILITGLSGCGKSSLIRLISDLVPEVYEGSYEGEVYFKNKNIKDYSKGEIYKYLSYVFQDPKDQFLSTTVEDELAIIGENIGMDRELLIKRVSDTIKDMGIDKFKNKTVFELSGGEKQLVAISSALVSDADLIIFDEPSASLDYKNINKLKDILRELKESGKTIIVVEHRLYYLKDLFDRLLYMENGIINSQYTLEELNEEKINELKIRTLNELNLKAKKQGNTKEEKIVVENLNVSINNKPLIKNLSFRLGSEEVMGIVGKNGIGKTTLAKSLCGLTNLNGYTSYGKNKKERLKNSYYVMQQADSQIFHESVEDEILFNNNDINKAKNLLKEVELFDKRLFHPQELSTGEKQRLTLLTSFIHLRKLLILDEPTSGLDYKRMNLISTLIERISKKIPVILITHDIELLFKTANTVLLISNEHEKIPIKGNEEKIIEFLLK